MKKILFHTGGPTFHPVGQQAICIAEWLGQGYRCEQREGLSAFEALDDSVDLLVIMGLHWSGMSEDWAGGLTYEPMRSRDIDALRKYVTSGRPIISHHGGIASYDEEPFFAQACAWAWVWGVTTHSPFGNWPMNVGTTAHAVVRDVQDYKLDDEIYYNVKVLEPGRTIEHASTYFDGAERPMVSTIDESSDHGRRVYLANGHDMKAFECDSLRQLWINSVKWSLDI